VINTALEVEMGEHVGYDKHDPAGRNGKNSRWQAHEAVLTELGPVPVDVPRDRDGSVEPQIVRKRQPRTGTSRISDMRWGAVSVR
jgi:putative transposase